MSAHLNPAVRHEAVLLFDCTDGNPNGDPDAQGQPRTDDETGQGLVTDVAIKRKIRDTVAMLHGADPSYQIFVEAGKALNPRTEEGWTNTKGTEEQAVAWLCGRYFDVRMFGAVLTRGKGIGAVQLRGPLQLTFARSIDPVLPADHTITRVTQTRQEDIDKGERTEIGSKWNVPYGMYRAHIYYSAPRAAQTGITSRDLGVLWSTIATMYEHDRVSRRCGVDLAGLWVFTHPDQYGVAPSRQLLERVKVSAIDPDRAPRAYTDYRRNLNLDKLPNGIEVTTIVDIWGEQ